MEKAGPGIRHCPLSRLASLQPHNCNYYVYIGTPSPPGRPGVDISLSFHSPLKRSALISCRGIEGSEKNEVWWPPKKKSLFPLCLYLGYNSFFVGSGQWCSALKTPGEHLTVPGAGPHSRQVKFESVSTASPSVL